MSNLPKELEEELFSRLPLTSMRKVRSTRKKSNMFNLPKELEEEVLSRIPMTSMRKIRFTCKKWNTLSKGRDFAKYHLDQATSKKCMVVMMMHYKIYLMSINLNDNLESCIQREAKLISLDDSYGVDFVNAMHCDGLLLCIIRDYTKLVVWNPYWGQTRCLEPTFAFHILRNYSHAIGYDKSNRNYKILTFIDWMPTPFAEFKIYDLNSDSWRVLDVPPPDGLITYYSYGVSLKGDTYWFAEDKPSEGNEGAFLVSFDFTKERFWPLLPLPFEWFPEDAAILSTVKEEKLAVLFQQFDTLMLEIWITTTINPNAVSWNSKVFLALDMTPHTNIQFNFMDASFFIDEEKKVVVVFDKENDCAFGRHQGIAYIVGVDGSLKEVYLGESPDEHCYPLVCSYVPSLVQLNDGRAEPSPQPNRRVSTRTRIPKRKFTT